MCSWAVTRFADGGHTRKAGAAGTIGSLSSTAFSRRSRPTGEHQLYFLHSLTPHMPFKYVPSGRRYSAPDCTSSNRSGPIRLMCKLRPRAALHLVSRQRESGRGWQALFDILSEARAFGHLQSIGCTGVHCIACMDKKTPDLGASSDGRSVFCEVKTINVSEDEAEKRSRMHNNAATQRRGHDGQVKQGEQEGLHARDSVGQTSGATPRCLNPGFSERIGNSRRTGKDTDRYRLVDFPFPRTTTVSSR